VGPAAMSLALAAFVACRPAPAAGIGGREGKGKGKEKRGKTGGGPSRTASVCKLLDRDRLLKKGETAKGEKRERGKRTGRS